MGYLISKRNDEKLFLRSQNIVGRSYHKSDLFIENINVSRIHATIEWYASEWRVRDLSRNGCYLNNKLLKKQKRYTLAKGQTLCFGPIGSEEFLVGDLTPPQDLLIPLEKQSECTKLKDINKIPDNSCPEFLLIFEHRLSQWKLIDLSKEADSEERVTMLHHGSIIMTRMGGWQLFTARHQSATQDLGLTNKSTPNLILSSSQDEESIEISISLDDFYYELGVKVHHYLILLLARKVSDDLTNNIDKSEAGWYDKKLLAKLCGMDVGHLDIQLHRYKKSLSGLEKKGILLGKSIESRRGQVRLYPAHISAYKSGKLEFKVD